MSHQIKSRTQIIGRRVCCPISVALAAVAIGWLVTLTDFRHDYSSGQDWDKLNRFVQTSNSTDAVVRAISDGRDLIENGEWVKAAKKFEDVLNRYPKDKNTDAALYWLAFSLKKQGKFQDANGQLARLVNEFPKSKWFDDAKAMQIEIANQVGNQKLVEQESQRDKNDELKLIALQALFQVDRERAAPLAADLLKADSKASKEMRELALNLLGRYGDKQYAPLFAEVARNESEADYVREQAISWIVKQSGDQAFESLLQLYDAVKKEYLKERILSWFVQTKNPRANAKIIEIARNESETEYLRERAISWVVQQGSDQTLETLVQLYTTIKKEYLKERILSWLAVSKDPRAQAKVVEIARTDESEYLREQAISRLAQHQPVETLIQLYDAQKSEYLKERIIGWLGQAKKPPAYQKLMQIVKSGDSSYLKERALALLIQSKDPEAMKFVEQIFK